MNHRKHLLGAAILASLMCGGLAFAQSGSTSSTTSSTTPTTATSPTSSSSPSTNPDLTHGSAVSGTAQNAPTGSSTHGSAVSSVAQGTRDFKRLDLNGDGSLSSTEVGSVQGLVFTDVDTDGNLSLSQSEYDAYLSSNAVATANDDDSNADDLDSDLDEN